MAEYCKGSLEPPEVEMAKESLLTCRNHNAMYETRQEVIFVIDREVEPAAFDPNIK